MLHIIWGILRILGILLLAILSLVVVLLLIFLFVPLCYRLRAEIQGGEPGGKGEVSWLLHLVYVSAEYRNKKITYAVKILGRTLFGSEKEQRDPWDDTGMEEAVHRRPTEILQEKADVTFRQEEKTDRKLQPEEGADIEFQPETPEETDRKPKPDRPTKEADAAEKAKKSRRAVWKIKRFFAGLSGAFSQFRQTVLRLREKISLFSKIYHNPRTQAAYRQIKKQALYLLRHVCPRKWEGELLFGMGDPADTGEILAVLCVLEGFSGNHLQVGADFERKVLEGDFYLKGHARGCHFAKAFLALFMDKNVRITIKRFLRMKKE